MTSSIEEEPTDDKEIIIDDLGNGTIVLTESRVTDTPTSAAKLLRGLYMSGMDIQVLVLGLYRSPEFIRVEPLKPPLEDFIFRHLLTSVFSHSQYIDVIVIGNYCDTGTSMSHRCNHRPLIDFRIETFGAIHTFLPVETTADIDSICCPFR